MRRLSLPLACLLALALAAPALAAKPARGCTRTFDLMNYMDFRDLSASVGVPEELLGPDHLAGWQSFDKNGDGLNCVKDLPDTPGLLGGWIFNVVDNTARK